MASPALAADAVDPDTKMAAPTDGRLTGDWGGRRDRWAEKGVSLGLEATYTFQGVAAGGLDGPAFRRVSDEDEIGNVVSGDIQLTLDTEKARWWRGGALESRLEGRAGRSTLQRAGTVSAVDNDALFPNVVDRFDEEALALTKLTFTQYLGEHVALFGGLLDTAEGDANALAGSALSNAHFLNSALLYALVEDATVPNVALGGGVLFEPNERTSMSLSAFGTEETAGTDPFAHAHGTTFSFEGTVGHALGGRTGAQTFGALYGIDASRVDIATDPRLGLGSVLRGEGLPETSTDTWALYYNAHQFVLGDDERGAGVFVRLGLSDGDPNVVRWSWAGGFAGRALVARRPDDTWGLGAFYLGLSSADLLKGLRVGDEVGGEMFYNVAVTSWLHVTLDLQAVDSALPRAGTTCVLGVRTHVAL